MSLVLTILVSVYHCFVMCGIFCRRFKRNLSSSLRRLSRYTIPKIHRTLRNHGFHSYKVILAAALTKHPSFIPLVMNVSKLFRCQVNQSESKS